MDGWYLSRYNMMMEESTHVLLYTVSQEPEHHMIAGLELEVSTILCMIHHLIIYTVIPAAT